MQGGGGAYGGDSDNYHGDGAGDSNGGGVDNSVHGGSGLLLKRKYSSVTDLKRAMISLIQGIKLG